MNPDLMSTPAPAGGESYWPWVQLSVGLLVIVVPSMAGAWYTIRSRRFDKQEAELQIRADHERAAHARQTEIELETERARVAAKQANDEKNWDFRFKQLEQDLERQKKFQDDQKAFQDGLIAENRQEKAYTKELMESLRLATDSVMKRDEIIRDRDRVIAAMQAEINELKAKVETLLKHVASLEQTRSTNEKGRG